MSERPITDAEVHRRRPLGDNRYDIELALQGSHWVGSAALRPAATPAGAADRDHVPRQRVH